jgi:hypothetical protein
MLLFATYTLTTYKKLTATEIVAKILAQEKILVAFEGEMRI